VEGVAGKKPPAVDANILPVQKESTMQPPQAISSWARPRLAFLRSKPASMKNCCAGKSKKEHDLVTLNLLPTGGVKSVVEELTSS
jgi:hypothetical protein